MRDFKRYEQGDKQSAAELNRLANELARLGKIAAVPPLKIRSDGTGLTFYSDDEDFWALIDKSTSAGGTNNSAVSYGFQEVFPVGDGTFTIRNGGRRGYTDSNPAYEVNGNAVAFQVVLMRFGSRGEYLFSSCCGTQSLSSSSSSGG